MTLRETLRHAAHAISEIGSAEAALEAELLLMHATGLDRVHLYESLADDLAADQADAFAAYLDRRLAHEPVPYITGHKEFFGLDFEVTRAALIPRPETETLIELATAFIRGKFGERRCAIADVGTGSGIIAVTLAHEFPATAVTATDTSAESLALARRNAERHGVAGRITFVECDLLPAHPSITQGEQVKGAGFDVIAANLPYVRTTDWEAMPPEIREHEPRFALDGGPDGLRVVERLLETAPAHLRPGGALFEEIGDEQGTAAADMARRSFPHARVSVEPDLAGRDRVLVVRLR